MKGKSSTVGVSWGEERLITNGKENRESILRKSNYLMMDGGGLQDSL